MSTNTQTIKELGQLLRLRHLREDAARQQRDACQRELASLIAQREAYERRWHALCETRRQLGVWMDLGGAADMARLNPYKTARREALDDQCERAEYDVIDTDDLITAARDRLAEANQHWVRCCAQRQAVEEMRQRHQQRRRIEADLKQEREAA